MYILSTISSLYGENTPYLFLFLHNFFHSVLRKYTSIHFLVSISILFVFILPSESKALPEKGFKMKSTVHI